MFDNTKLVNRTSFLIASLAVGIMMFSLVNYVMQSWFLVNKIVVVGDLSHLTENNFKVATQDQLYGNFFTLNIDNLQDDFKKIPWVRDVTVTRKFPHTIEVNLSEYTAVAKLSDEELITPEGKVFLGQAAGESLPFFNTAIKNSREALSDYNILKPILDKRNLKLVELNLNGTGITRVTLSNNLTVTICGTDFAKNLTRLDKNWDSLYKLNPSLATVNMCYKNAVAINDYKKVESSVNVLNSSTNSVGSVTVAPSANSAKLVKPTNIVQSTNVNKSTNMTNVGTTNNTPKQIGSVVRVER